MICVWGGTRPNGISVWVEVETDIATVSRFRCESGSKSRVEAIWKNAVKIPLQVGKIWRLELCG